MKTRDFKKMIISDVDRILSKTDIFLNIFKENDRSINMVYEIWVNKKTYSQLSDELGITMDRIRQLYFKGMYRIERIISKYSKEIIDFENLKVEHCNLKNKYNSIVKLLPNEENLQGIRIWDLDLSIRAMNVLKAGDIEYLIQLTSLRKYELMRFRNCGKKTCDEIENVMKKYGISFKSKK